MRGYLVTALPRTVRAAAAALLLILALIGSAAAQTNLALQSKPFSSTDWESDQGNKTFIAAKAFDGDLTTRWNSASGDDNGSFLGTRWDTPQTITKVVIREAFNRVNAFRVQQFDTGKNDWVDSLNATGPAYDAVKGGDANNPTFSMRFKPALQTTGIRIVFDDVTAVPSIFEVEAYNSPAGTLQGTVRDEQGAAVVGAIVQAGSDSTTTDANGKYSLTADAGTYNVTAGKPGAFRTKLVRAVTIAPDSNATLDFALVALPPNLALKAKAASSSDWEDGTDYNAAKANDSNLATRWNARADDVNGAWLEMDWDAAQTLTKVTVREAFDRIRNYTLQQWDTTKNNWADIITNAAVPARGGNPVLSNVFAKPITTNKVRLLVVNADDVASIFEMEVTNPATATIHGVVTDVATGLPVPNATVVSDLGETVVADSKGAFTLVVEPDDYVLSAQATGFFAGKAVPVTIKAGETQEVTITLPATGPNIAKGMKTAASSEDPSQPASNITDGDLETYWTSASDQVTNQWVAVTFDKPTHFTAVQLRGFIGVIQKSDLQVLADDGKTWVDVPNTSLNPEFIGPNADLFFPAGITTTSVRYFIVATNSTTNIPGLSEMLIFDAPLPQ
jgi:hypothetical protein